MNATSEYRNLYQSPEILLIEIKSEGVLCGSTDLEGLRENNGNWI